MGKQKRGAQQPHVVVCVTTQRSCVRLIQAGAEQAKQEGLPLSVVHVATGDQPWLGADNPDEVLDFLFQQSSAAGADMTVIRSQDAAQAIADFARQNGARYLVLGAARGAEEGAFGRRLKQMLGDTSILTVEG
nr:universal stress protein [bacterium]